MPAEEWPAYIPFRSAKSRDRYMARYGARAETWPIASESRMVTTSNEQTFVRISGPPDGPPLVLLPGEWDTSLMWMPVIEALSGSFRTYAVDNPYDFGRSSSTQPLSGTVDYMTWLNELFDELDLPAGVNLMGCSFGAWLTAEYLLYAPHRLAKAVWLSPPFAVLLPPLKSYVGGPLSAGAFVTPSRASALAYLGWLMPHTLRAPWFRQRVEETALGLKGFNARLVLTEPRLLSDSELRCITVPLLYVAGELEQMCSVQDAAARLNAVAPQIETEIIPGAGHELPLGQPEAFSQRVLQFLGEH